MMRFQTKLLLVLLAAGGLSASLSVAYAAPRHTTNPAAKAYAAHISPIMMGVWRATASIGSATDDVKRSDWTDANSHSTSALSDLTRARSILIKVKAPAQLRKLQARYVQIVNRLVQSAQAVHHGVVSGNGNAVFRAVSTFRTSIAAFEIATKSLSSMAQ